MKKLLSILLIIVLLGTTPTQYRAEKLWLPADSDPLQITLSIAPQRAMLCNLAHSASSTAGAVGDPIELINCSTYGITATWQNTVRFTVARPLPKHLLDLVTVRLRETFDSHNLSVNSGRIYATGSTSWYHQSFGDSDSSNYPGVLSGTSWSDVGATFEITVERGDVASTLTVSTVPLQSVQGDSMSFDILNFPVSALASAAAQMINGHIPSPDVSFGTDDIHADLSTELSPLHVLVRRRIKLGKRFDTDNRVL